MPSPPAFDNDLTPLPKALPHQSEVPMRIVSIETALVAQARVIKELREERAATSKGFRTLWLAMLGVGVTILLTASAALLQMGAYMERIDQVSASQRRVEERVDQVARIVRSP